MKMENNVLVSGFRNYDIWDIDDSFFTEDEAIWIGITRGLGCVALEDGKEFRTNFDNNFVIPQKGKIWIHPRCKIPRSEVYGKYTKAPDVFSADIVVIPKERVCSRKGLFIIGVNEEKNMCCITGFSEFRSNNFKAIASKVEIGKTKLGDLAKLNKGIQPTAKMPCDLKSFEESVIVKCCHGTTFSSTLDYLLDIHEGIIPESKVIYECDFRKQVEEGSELTVGELSSVYDMLISRDMDNKALALRTLATLPYASYPCSVTFILVSTLDRYTATNWSFSNATRLTAVNAMLKHLHYYRRNMNYNAFYSITEKDWKLLRQVMKKYKGYDFWILKDMPFLKIDPDTDTIYPKLCD